MKLEEIGFYTLSDKRAATASATTPLSRCELILSSRCNFACPYCRGVGGPDMPLEKAEAIVRFWASEGLFAIRFSGGEPLMYPGLLKLVELSKALGIERIAISSNGSYPLRRYEELIRAGVNDLSISLDACCAEDGDKMAGDRRGVWEVVTSNIRELAKKTYLTVGVVLTPDNAASVENIIEFAADMEVGDIRIIPAAQVSDRLTHINVKPEVLKRYPILAYRIANIQSGVPVRGLIPNVSPNRCGLVVDDMAVAEGKHYPCIIYMREGGQPIGSMDNLDDVRGERARWAVRHDVSLDKICSKQCLDVCVDYNTKYAKFHNTPEEESSARPRRFLPIIVDVS